MEIVYIRYDICFVEKHHGYRSKVKITKNIKSTIWTITFEPDVGETSCRLYVVPYRRNHMTCFVKWSIMDRLTPYLVQSCKCQLYLIHPSLIAQYHVICWVWPGKVNAENHFLRYVDTISAILWRESMPFEQLQLFLSLIVWMLCQDQH